MDKTSMTLGWLVGRQIAGQRSKQKTPIAYLYNGVQLPALPELDGLGYLFIDNVGGGSYDLYLTPKLPVVKQLPTGYGDNTGDWLCNVMGGQIWCYKPDLGAWAFKMNLETDEVGIWSFGQGLWSSHDVYNEDGSLYLAASDPIPVYA